MDWGNYRRQVGASQTGESMFRIAISRQDKLGYFGHHTQQLAGKVRLDVLPQPVLLCYVCALCSCQDLHLPNLGQSRPDTLR